MSQTSLLSALSHVIGAANRLRNSEHDAQTINEVLAGVGQVLDVDRIYIFENSERADGTIVANQRYEWVARHKGVSVELENPLMQDMSYEEFLPKWLEPLSHDLPYWGLPHDQPPRSREMMESQNIQSVLLCPITFREHWWGFVGFDDCHQPREWKDEIFVLQGLARAFAGSLRHRKLRQKLEAAHRQLWGIMSPAAP
jgi:GAF domain-containing protein